MGILLKGDGLTTLSAWVNLPISQECRSWPRRWISLEDADTGKHYDNLYRDW